MPPWHRAVVGGLDGVGAAEAQKTSRGNSGGVGATTAEKAAAAGGGGSVDSVGRLGMREATEPEGRIVWRKKKKKEKEQAVGWGKRKWRKRFFLETWGLLWEGRRTRFPLRCLGPSSLDRSGRRFLLTVSASVTFLACFLTAISFYLKAHGLFPEWVPELPLSGILVCIGAYSIGMGFVPWVVMSELPTWQSHMASSAMICSLLQLDII